MAETTPRFMISQEDFSLEGLKNALMNPSGAGASIEGKRNPQLLSLAHEGGVQFRQFVDEDV